MILDGFQGHTHGIFDGSEDYWDTAAQYACTELEVTVKPDVSYIMISSNNLAVRGSVVIPKNQDECRVPRGILSCQLAEKEIRSSHRAACSPNDYVSYSILSHRN